jgi:6-bladed beta-propeller
MTSASERLVHSVLVIIVLGCSAKDGSSDGGMPGSPARARVDGLPVGTDSIVATRLLRIGQLDGAPEYAFGRIDAIATTADGGFYLCDSNDVSIRRYDSSGAFIRKVGRKGAGPGEYGMCADIAVARDGGLAVSDPSNGRVAFFRPDGEFDRVVSVNVSPGLMGGENIFFVDSAGRMWKRGWLAAEGVGESSIPNQYVVLDSKGTRLDSVAVPAPGPGPGRGFMLCTNDGCYVAQPQDTLSAIDQDGLIAAAGPMSYRITLRARDGSTREITRSAEQVAYTGPELAQWESWRAYMEKQTPQYPPIAIPKRKPILRELRFDDVGRLWVKVHVTAEDRPIPPRPAGDPRPLLTWRERNTFDLFDVASGGYIGRVAFPYATVFLTSRGNKVWLREEGESGEMLIGIYELKAARVR